MIAMRHEHDDYMRRANVKVAVLKEVIDRLYRGEDVDVEGMLGAGDEKEERSWQEGRSHISIRTYFLRNIFVGIAPNRTLCSVTGDRGRGRNMADKISGEPETAPWSFCL